MNDSTSTPPRTMPRPRVALVHDYLTQRGGAERVVLAMARAFPDATIHTSLYEPGSTYPEFADDVIRTSPIDRIGLLRRNHRLALPVLAPAFSGTSVDADVAVCSSSGWAHGARVTGRKLVYCHAPARWLHQADAYTSEASALTRGLLAVLRRPLLGWDARAAASADRYLVNSTRTQQMVRDAYGIDAEVLHPPHGIDASGSLEAPSALEPGFFLCVSRLLPYKGLDALLAAFAAMPQERLVIVGSGPDRERLHQLAGSNVTFLESIPDPQLRWLYTNADALLAVGIEDFGLTPVEAAAFGTPTIARPFGGYLDTVTPGVDGTFLEEVSDTGVTRAIAELRALELRPDVIIDSSTRFSEDRFAQRLRTIVDELAQS